VETSWATVSGCWSSVGVKGSAEARINEGEEVAAESRWRMMGTRWGTSSSDCRNSSASAAMWLAAKGEMRWCTDIRGRTVIDRRWIDGGDDDGGDAGRRAVTSAHEGASSSRGERRCRASIRLEVVEVEGGGGVVGMTGSCVPVIRAAREPNNLPTVRRGLLRTVSAVTVGWGGGGAEVCCGGTSELKPTSLRAGGRGGEMRWGVTKYSIGPRRMRGGLLFGTRAAVVGIDWWWWRGGVSAYVKSECAESKFNTRRGVAACWGVEAVWGRPVGGPGGDIGLGDGERKGLGVEASD
jgi:hypothetical protein